MDPSYNYEAIRKKTYKKNEKSFSYLTWNAQLEKEVKKKKLQPQHTKEIVSFIAIPLNKVEEFIFSWMSPSLGKMYIKYVFTIYIYSAFK